ncbi:MarR family winged helix-turn-helix transcriptional regulator [Methylomagnum sp.]
MNSEDIYEYLERIANLIRTDVRRTGIASRLQPVQLEALHYLSRCNQYSNTPVAVAEFLGLTKGTVSQTLGVLEANRLIEKQADARDRRVVHLNLSELGKQVVTESIPPQVFRTAVEGLSAREEESVLDTLTLILRRLQWANGLKTFGACKSCRHHQVGQGGARRCALTTEALTDADAEKLCREHEFPQ